MGKVSVELQKIAEGLKEQNKLLKELLKKLEVANGKHIHKDARR